MRKRNLLIALTLVLLVAVAICVYLGYSRISNDAGRAISELIALPDTTTDGDLERDGFLRKL